MSGEISYNALSLMRFVFAFAALVAASLPFACGGSSANREFGNGDGGAGGDADPDAAISGDDSSVDPGDGGGPVGKTVVYAHTDTTLYSFDPANLNAAITKVGDFDCVGKGGSTDKAMTDLAVGKDGSIFGVSQSGAYPLVIQGTTVHCSATWPLPSNSNFYGMTMAPEGTVAATEVLITANAGGQLYRVDANTGATTQVGTMKDPASNKPLPLSGDIVFLANKGSPIGFATVCPTSGCSGTDDLVEIDVTKVKPGTQNVVKSIRGPVKRGANCANTSGPATFGGMFGIAAYEDKVFGFSRQGDIVEINNNDGSGCLVKEDSTLQFAGAGVTTLAPVQPPPPK